MNLLSERLICDTILKGLFSWAQENILPAKGHLLKWREDLWFISFYCFFFFFFEAVIHLIAYLYLILPILIQFIIAEEASSK